MLYPHRVSMKTSKSTVLLEPVVGIEPTTYGLRNRCSTTELHRRCALRE